MVSKVPFSITNKTSNGVNIVHIDIEGDIGYNHFADTYEDYRNNTKEEMKRQLKAVAEIKADEIHVSINSYGGDVNHAISIHDLLKENSAKIITKINGFTASSGTIIFMSGDERHISENALFLIHCSSSSSCGNKNDMLSHIKAMEACDRLIANLYIKNGVSEKDVSDLMSRNNGNGEWILGQEAYELGFATKVYEPSNISNIIDNDELKKRSLPFVHTNKIKNRNMPEENQDTQETTMSLLNKISSKLDAFKNAFKDAKNDGGVEKNVADAMKKINDLDSQVKNIRSSIAEKDGEIKRLTEEVERFQSELKSKEDEISNVQSENASLKEANLSMSKQNVEPEMPQKKEIYTADVGNEPQSYNEQIVNDVNRVREIISNKK